MFKLFVGLSLLLLSWSSSAAKVEVSVYGPDKEVLANAVVYLLPAAPITPTSQTAGAIMDQIDTQFSPHILAVQKESLVRFPNSDSIKHHVYSFSTAKVFELQLYKGLQAEPLMFSKIGPVELGCNVHDWMLGYVYVVDTPYFTKTDINGKAVIAVPNGDYQINTWHPRIQDDIQTLSLDITVTEDLAREIVIPSELSPSLQAFENEVDEFDDY